MTLHELAGEAGDVDDPFGQGEDRYRATKDEIKRCLELGVDRMLTLLDDRKQKGEIHPMSDEHILYDPTAEPQILASGLAPRLASLEGKRAGILDNSKANAGTLMLAVAARLKEKYGVARRRQAREGHRGRAQPRHPGRAHDVRLRPGRQRRLRVVHVVEYPRRHRAGAAGDPHRGHGDV